MFSFVKLLCNDSFGVLPCSLQACSLANIDLPSTLHLLFKRLNETYNTYDGYFLAISIGTSNTVHPQVLSRSPFCLSLAMSPPGKPPPRDRKEPLFLVFQRVSMGDIAKKVFLLRYRVTIRDLDFECSVLPGHKVATVAAHKLPNHQK